MGNKIMALDEQHTSVDSITELVLEASACCVFIGLQFGAVQYVQGVF